MNRRILALACLFAIICVLIIIQLIANQYTRTSGQRNKTPLVTASTTSAVKPTEAPSPKTPPVVQSPAPPSTPEPAPTGETDSPNLRMETSAIIAFEGRLIEGARYRVDWAGPKLPPIAPFAGVSGMARSDANGMSKTTVGYPQTLSRDSIFYAIAYHPEFGSTYITFTLEELKALSQEPIHLELERGAVIQGELVDQNGQPVPHGRVRLMSGSPITEINLTGLEVETKEDGTFTMAGIRFDNTLSALQAYILQPSDSFQFEGDRPRPKRVGTTRIPLQDMPVQDGQTVDAGKIQLPIDLAATQK
jgi:hypothetical protein